MRIIFSSNSSWSVYNFRSNLLQALAANNHEVFVVAPSGGYLELLKESGYQTIPININNSSKGFYSNIKLLSDLYSIYQSIKPDIVLHNAIKPNIYGALICRLLNIPVINNISGFGAIFMSGGITSLFGIYLYRLSQKKVQKVFFQNSVDFEQFINKKIIKLSQCELLPGSGVDLERFKPVARFRNDNITKFCFVGRLLGDKGVYEYIDAAKAIKKKYEKTQFFILGELYLQHPTAITQGELDNWIKSGIVTFLGKSDHVEEELYKFDCIVLPSYREGLSRVLLEASSMEIPAITSNVPGCIDVIIDGYNGFISKVKDSKDLVLQMERFLKLPESERLLMGKNGRLKVENEFDEKIVIDRYLKAIENIKIS